VYNHHKKKFVNQFIEKHKQNKKWKNNTCISAIAFTFQIDIKVIISTRTNSQHYKTGRNNNPKLTLLKKNLKKKKIRLGNLDLQGLEM
jgi:hypothetical protein